MNMFKLFIGAVALVSPACAIAAQTTGTAAWVSAGIANGDQFPPDSYLNTDGSKSLVYGQNISSAESAFSDFGIDSSAKAYADLTSGKMGVYGSSNYAFLRGQPASTNSNAQLKDQLNFLIGGATANTVTPITVLFSVDGTVNGRTGYGTSVVIAQLFLDSGVGVGLYKIAQDNRDVPFYASAANWQSYSTSVSGNTTTFKGVYNLVGSSKIIDIFGTLDAATSAESTADFQHTAALQFVLPQNVSFTSASGSFLSNVPGVPEPATWAMMLLGFGMIGFAMRKRSNVSTAVSYA